MDREYMARVEKALQDLWLAKNKAFLQTPIDQDFGLKQANNVGYMKALMDVQTVFMEQSKIQDAAPEQKAEVTGDTYNV